MSNTKQLIGCLEIIFNATLMECSNTGEEYSTPIGEMFRENGIKVLVKSKVKSYVSHQKENINIFINF